MANDGVPIPVIRDHDEGDASWSFGGHFSYKLRKDESNGSLGIMEVALEKGTGPPRHIHPNEDDVYLVLEGELTFTVGGETRAVGPGGVVFIPRGTPHEFRVSSQLARFYNMYTPGGFEDFFWRCGEPSRGQAVPSQPLEELIEAAREHNPPLLTPAEFIPIGEALGLQILGGALQVGSQVGEEVLTEERS